MAARTPGGSIIHPLGPSIPVSPLSFTLFAGRGGNREGSLLRCSFSRFFRPLLLFSRSPLRLPKINREKLAVFLRFFLSLSLSLSGETVSSSVPSYSPGSLFCSSLLYSLPRDNQIIRVVPLMKNTSNLLDEKILHRT